MNQQSHTRLRDTLAAADAMAVLSLFGLVLLSGLIISLYTVMVRHVTLRTSTQDCVNQAARDIAESLSKVYVSDAVFGKIGLCDQSPSDANNGSRVISLNRLYATLAADALVADRLQMPFLTKLVAADLERAHTIQDQLVAALHKAVARNGRNDSPLYTAAKRDVENGHNPDSVFIDMRVSLGFFAEAKFPSMVSAPASLSDERVVAAGQYKPNVGVPLPGNLQVMFYQVAPKCQLCDAAGFSIPNNNVVAPSSVQVDATYKISAKEKKIDIVRTLTACAIVGGGTPVETPSVFMVSFPHGKPAVLTSLRDLLVYGGKSGEWQQSIGGDVPGKGHLAAPMAIEAAEMPPAQATQTAFYHWLRSLGPDVAPEKVAGLVDEPWAKLAVQASEARSDLPEKPDPNSALTKDMGARAFALFFQSAPGGVGQKVLADAFSCKGNDDFPKSALPLDVGADGNCNLAGRTGFDAKLVSDFLESVYQTNLACTESNTTAEAIANRLDQAASEEETEMKQTHEELDSIDTRIERLPGQHPQAQELNDLRRNQLKLQARLNTQTAKIDNYHKVASRARTVASNAVAGAQATFNLIADMRKNAADGLFRLDKQQGFLLGHDQAFLPATKPVTEEEIYDAEDVESGADWTSKHFAVLRPASPLMSVGGHSLNQLPSESRRARLPSPLFIVLDSRVLSGTNPHALALSESPFADSGVPQGQLIFYAQDAIRTGSKPEVGWSVLIRDAAAYLVQSEAPIHSNRSKLGLSDDMTMGSFPGLAAEVQVRAPVPVMPELPVGSSLVNPTNHERVSEIPPTPPSML